MASPLYMTLLAGPVEALPVPKPVIDALVSVEIEEKAVEQSGFQLTFTLGNDSILQTLFLLASGSPIPAFRVVVVVTFGGLPQVVMDGIVEHVEVAPRASGGETHLVVTGHDLSALMGLIDFSGVPYPAMTPDVRVLAILAKYAAFGIVPQVVPVPVPDVPVPVERIPVQQGTDLAYITQLAGEAGYVFYIIPGPVPGMSLAYWGPRVRIGIPQPALNINMDAWTNVEDLTFKYEPTKSVLPIVYLHNQLTGLNFELPIPPVTPFDPPLGLVVPTPQTIEQMKDTAKLSPATALMQGMAKAVESSDVVSGDGSLDVLRYGQVLRARSLVGVRGAGLAYDGMHYVESVTHSLKPGEYKQKFELKRNALVTNTPVVPTLPY